MKKLPIGESDFRNIITEEYYYVDKSLFIKEVIDDSALVMLLPRPRRFGKTLNISMLRYFFEKTEREEDAKGLFRGLSIEQEEFFDTHCGQYPVIFLTFKDVKYLHFEEAFHSIKSLVAEEFRRHQYLLEGNLLDAIERIRYQEIITLTAETVYYHQALRDLCGYLYRYYNQKPLILIDEYDTPIHTAFIEGYYKKIVSFFRSFFGAGLKDNPHLFKGVLTGILRVARESIFSDLNNLGVYSLLRPEYCDKFGFTEHDVRTLLREYHREELFEEVNAWYNGYVFGETIIYNPWSILNFVASKDKTFRNYWANTSSNRMLKDLIAHAPESVKTEFHNLLQDIPLTKRLDENIVFTDLTYNERAVYSFLVFSGYLKAYDEEHLHDKTYHTLLIPNKEVKQIFEDVLMIWINEAYENRKLQMLLHALTENDIPTFEEILSDFVLSTLSYFDTQHQDVERVYQAFMLGMLLSLSPAYEVNSNKESGFGRYDICLIPKDSTKRAIIMELKKIGMHETKDTALKNALKQIEDKKYETDIRKRGITAITKLAVTFDGKRVWVRTGEEGKKR